MNEDTNMQNTQPINTKSQNHGCLISIIVIIAFFAIIGLIIPDSENEKTSKDSTYISCYYFSQNLVKKQLKSPKSADFPWYSDSFIKDKGDTIIVSAYVDADNSFGANIRTNYVATIKVKNGEPVSGFVSFR